MLEEKVIKGKWSREKAWEWYNNRTWMRGCNFMGSDCANRIDQWQELGFEERIVTADRELLSLVWSNLFSNAFKFTESGGRVTVTLEAEERYATVKITDTGCGISPDVGAHIFEKFYQGDTSRATQGNGLGLALVKRVVDITHGEIGVESTVGVGTTFAVKIRREKNELEKDR